MMKSEFDLFCEWAGSALANRHLHSVVQKRLSELLAKEFPDNPSVAEVFGVEGGRNDLIHYEQSGATCRFRIVLFSKPSSARPSDTRTSEGTLEIRRASGSGNPYGNRPEIPPSQSPSCMAPLSV